MKKNKTIIIAEIGVNHNGKISNAFKLILAAKKAGADYAKFQTFFPDEMVTKKAKKAPYQRLRKKNQSQKDLLKKYIFSLSDYKKIIKFCNKNKIKFLTTAFDLKSFKLISSFKLDYYKIPSGEINNVPLLKVIGKKNKNLLLSTGMSNLSDIKFSLIVLKKNGQNLKKVTVLHCNSAYPTPTSDVNLKSISYIKNKLNQPVGLSDHSESVIVPALAICFGAGVIEKHLTLNKKMIGPDHKASLIPNEFSTMVRNIRIAENALGKYEKKPTKSEKINIKFSRKSIVAKIDIKKNQILNEKNLITKRPGIGESAKNWDLFIGRKVKKNILKDQFIFLKDVR